ncbi:helix-turn-helix transcriptional regulator [Anatilimnocola floriformis]|uniref:helix-turn-helix transcriptional regulator n=1 Tax=Anatilimnocola floriformis TaxID=2948575 RepID=UPI0020C425DB|nr:helix-turn-helix domain-containing protein [Anatilimnocola floriformis]
MKTIQLQLSVTIGDDAARILAEIFGPAIKQAQTPTSSDVDERREARVRASQNALFAGQKPPEDQGLLIDSREAAKLLKVSPRKLWAMQNDGRMPAPIRIGKAVRWSYEALKKWVEQGCPNSATSINE